MLKHLKKLSEKIIHKNPWWTYKHDRYEKPDGKEGDYYYGVTPGNVMLVPVLPDGRVVLIRQSRYLLGKESIEFPAGGISPGETAVEAAQKELLEETGYRASDFIKIGVFQGLIGMFDDLSHVFIAQVGEQSQQQLDDTEDIEVFYRRADEFDEMIRRNEIVDGQTLATWALVRHAFFKQECETESPTLGTLLENVLDIH